MKKLILSSVILLLGLWAGAQNIKLCGTDASPLDDSIYMAKVAQFNADTTTPPVLVTRYVPVIYHIIRQSDGTGGAVADALDDVLADISEKLDTAGFNFFRCEEPNYIDADDYFAGVTQGSLMESDIVGDHARSGAINIFFVPKLIDDNGIDTICGFARFPWQGGNYLFINNECAADGSTLLHQIGHYFGLYHTHHASSVIEAEHVTRTQTDTCYNCATAGDLLCDTEADPGLSALNVDAMCNYLGLVKDSCNLATPAQILDYTPDVSNLMSLAPANCRKNLSAGQLDRMVDFYFDSRMMELDPMGCTNSPCYDDVVLPLGMDTTITAIKTIRASGSITSIETIDVSDSPGVTYKAGGFVSLNPGFETIKGSVFSAYIEGCTNLLPDDEQDFLVIPKEKPGLMIAPNPVASELTFWFKLPKEGRARLQILSATGQLIEVLTDGNFQEGLHSISWNAGALRGGLYFVSLQSNGEQTVQKMVKLE
ncbi:MAG: hypothetical protein CMN32_09455 [Saprospirales bacterium]|nr:hypothetical protein [Saprospirales bacterium]